jgi:hypothetical protein
VTHQSQPFVTFKSVVDDIAVFEVLMPYTAKLHDTRQLAGLGSPDREDFVFARPNIANPTIKVSLGPWQVKPCAKHRPTRMDRR